MATWATAAPDAGADHRRPDQSRNATHGVHDGRPGKIVETEIGEPSTAPHPVADDRIDEGGDQERVDQIRDEPHSLGHRTGDDRSDGSSEDRLEQPEGLQGQSIDRGFGTRQRPALEAHERPLATVHQSVSEQEEPQCGEAEVEHVLHQGIGSVLRSDESRFDHSEAGLHQEHEKRGNEHPQGAEPVVHRGRIHRYVLGEDRCSHEYPSQTQYQPENHLILLELASNRAELPASRPDSEVTLLWRDLRSRSSRFE